MKRLAINTCISAQSKSVIGLDKESKLLISLALLHNNYIVLQIDFAEIMSSLNS